MRIRPYVVFFPPHAYSDKTIRLWKVFERPLKVIRIKSLRRWTANIPSYQSCIAQATTENEHSWQYNTSNCRPAKGVCKCTRLPYKLYFDYVGRKDLYFGWWSTHKFNEPKWRFGWAGRVSWAMKGRSRRSSARLASNDASIKDFGRGPKYLQKLLNLDILIRIW